MMPTIAPAAPAAGALSSEFARLIPALKNYGLIANTAQFSVRTAGAPSAEASSHAKGFR
jgi:hypothetical protein